MRAKTLAQLDSGQADAPGRAQRKQRFAGFEPRPMRQGDMRRAIGKLEGGAMFIAHLGWHWKYGRGGHDDFFGVSAMRHHRHHSLPHLNALDITCHLDDFAGDFQARAEGERRLELVQALDHQDVGEVDAASARRDSDLARAQSGPGDVAEPQVFRRAEPVAENRFHAGIRRRRQSATGLASKPLKRSMQAFTSPISTVSLVVCR